MPNSQSTTITTGQNKRSSQKNLNESSNNNDTKKKTVSLQVSKANIRTLALQSKENLVVKKRLIRERNEKALKGGYELIYPYISYEEEEKVRERTELLR